MIKVLNFDKCAQSVHFQQQKKGQPFGSPLLMVMALGFEPRTACLEGRCSIQLSYATIFQMWVQTY